MFSQDLVVVKYFLKFGEISPFWKTKCQTYLFQSFETLFFNVKWTLFGVKHFLLGMAQYLVRFWTIWCVFERFGHFPKTFLVALCFLSLVGSALRRRSPDRNYLMLSNTYIYTFLCYEIPSFQTSFLKINISDVLFHSKTYTHWQCESC
jgi:hypothetical protein